MHISTFFLRYYFNFLCVVGCNRANKIIRFRRLQPVTYIARVGTDDAVTAASAASAVHGGHRLQSGATWPGVAFGHLKAPVLSRVSGTVLCVYVCVCALKKGAYGELVSAGSQRTAGSSPWTGFQVGSSNYLKTCNTSQSDIFLQIIWVHLTASQKAKFHIT